MSYQPNPLHTDLVMTSIRPTLGPNGEECWFGECMSDDAGDAPFALRVTVTGNSIEHVYAKLAMALARELQVLCEKHGEVIDFHESWPGRPDDAEAEDEQAA